MKNIENLLRNWKGKKILMTIYPHPDDETMGAGGLLYLAHQLGYQTIVVSLTAGGAGKVHTNLNGKSLIEIRTQELKKATEILNVNKVIVGKFPDGKLREEKWQNWVLDQIKTYQPGIIITYDHSGNSGHPDHIVLSVELKRLLKRMKTPPKIFWTSTYGLVRKRMVKKTVAEYSPLPTHFVNINLLRKWLAVKAHASQRLGKNLPVPMWLALFLFGRQEWYHEVDIKKSYPYKFVPFDI